MKNNFSLLFKISTFICAMQLLACKPFEQEQEKMRVFIQEKPRLAVKPEEQAQQLSRVNREQQNSWKKVSEASVSSELQDRRKDPFKTIDFFVSKDTELFVEQIPENRPCRPQTGCRSKASEAKTALRAYPLERLEFTGTIGFEKTFFALVRTPGNRVIQAYIGDAVGQNDGTIIRISETEVVVREPFYHSGKWATKEIMRLINP